MSLIEVIVCTAIVAVMLVPIAGVIRASGQSISQATGTASVEARLRTGLRWLAAAIRQGDVVAIRTRRLTLRMPDTSIATVDVRRGRFVINNNGTETTLVEGVRDVQFQVINRVTPPVTRTGLSVSLRARDPNGGWVTVTSAIAEPPQI